MPNVDAYKKKICANFSKSLWDFTSIDAYFQYQSKPKRSARVCCTVLLNQTKNIRRAEENKGKLSPFATSDIMKSPFRFSTYQALCNDADEDFPNRWHDSIDTNSDLYNQLLEYKCRLCEIAIEEYQKKFANFIDSHVQVYYQNLFPCLMVQIKIFGKESFSSSFDAKYLNQIWIAYLVAIINYHAYMENIPTEISHRASFGHNLPSLVNTDTVFRINMGLVPEIYVRDVLVKSFLKLNEIVPQILNAKIGLNSNELQKINDDISAYNKKQSANIPPDSNDKSEHRQNVEFWSADDTFFDVLFKVSDSSGCMVCIQIKKERRYIDLLINYVLDEYLSRDEKACPAAPLKKLLMHLSFDGDEVTLNVKDINLHHPIYAVPKRDFVENTITIEKIRNDSNFWNCIEKISASFQKRSIFTLTNAVANKRMQGMYRSIEEANLELIMNSGDQKCEDGYGSDSDCEIDIPINAHTGKRKVYRSKKILTATGMRAIYATAFLLKYHSGIEHFNCEHTYYEISGAVQTVLDTHLSFDVKPKSDQTVQLIDLNYCNASGNTDVGHVNLEEIKRKELSALNGKTSEAIVLDYAAATTDKIRAAIDLFIPYTRIVLLVTSALKNEQIGADINPYGAIRIICDNGELVDHLCEMVKSIIAEIDRMDGIVDEIELPMHAHNIRKCYKQIGATVTSQAIFKHTDWIYNKVEKIKMKRNMDEFKLKYPEVFECLMDDMASNDKTVKIMNGVVVDWNVWKTEMIESDVELLNISFELQSEKHPIKLIYNATKNEFIFRNDY